MRRTRKSRFWELSGERTRTADAKTRLPFNRSTLEVVAADWGTS